MSGIPSVEKRHEQLSPSLVEILEILDARYPNFVSTLDFLQAGILSPAAGICRLKARGAIIETETKTIIDGSGKPRKKIACYRLVDWVL